MSEPTYSERMLALVEKKLEEQTGNNIRQVGLGGQQGRSTEYFSVHDELIKQRKYWLAEVKKEKEKASRYQGIRVNF